MGAAILCVNVGTYCPHDVTYQRPTLLSSFQLAASLTVSALEANISSNNLPSDVAAGGPSVNQSS